MKVDDKNLKGYLLHLTFSLSEGNIFWERGRVEAGRVTFEGIEGYVCENHVKRV